MKKLVVQLKLLNHINARPLIRLMIKLILVIETVAIRLVRFLVKKKIVPHVNGNIIQENVQKVAQNYLLLKYLSM